MRVLLVGGADEVRARRRAGARSERPGTRGLSRGGRRRGHRRGRHRRPRSRPYPAQATRCVPALHGGDRGVVAARRGLLLWRRPGEGESPGAPGGRSLLRAVRRRRRVGGRSGHALRASRSDRVSWRDPDWKGETEVDVVFAADGDGTTVSLTHRGFERVGPDGSEIAARWAGGWPRVMEAFAERTRR